MTQDHNTSESSPESTSRNSRNGPGGPLNHPEPTPLNILMVSAAVVTVWHEVAPSVRQVLQWLLTVV
jgi:hypothetical protein